MTESADGFFLYLRYLFRHVHGVRELLQGVFHVGTEAFDRPGKSQAEPVIMGRPMISFL